VAKNQGKQLDLKPKFLPLLLIVFRLTKIGGVILLSMITYGLKIPKKIPKYRKPAIDGFINLGYTKLNLYNKNKFESVLKN